MPRHQTQHGFTLIEMVVVVAIIASLAAILVPVMSDELDQRDLANARWQCQRIATSINQYMKDVRQDPSGVLGAQTYHYLVGSGPEPATNPFSSGTKGTLFEFLCDGTTNGGTRWKGPYLQQVPEDPWGRAYVINSHGFFAGENVWVLSAGPNGNLDTGPGDFSLQGDDLGFLIE
jgi:general secretion pathway protein G